MRQAHNLFQARTLQISKVNNPQSTISLSQKNQTLKRPGFFHLVLLFKNSEHLKTVASVDSGFLVEVLYPFGTDEEQLEFVHPLRHR